MTRTATVFATLLLGATVFSNDAQAQAWGKCPSSVRDLADRADRITRGSSSKGVMSMKVFKRGTVSMRMKIWSKGRNKFLAKILRPSRLRGMATLKSGNNLWNYLPRMDKIVKLGSSMMGGSWMGSHFTNDDLVKETDMRKHYTCTAYKESGGFMIITTKPRPNAPVVWGKVLMKVRKSDSMPFWTKYYDERGSLKRTMRFEAIKQMGGRVIPTRMVLQPADSPSERTVVSFHNMHYNISIPNRTFTLQGLKQ
ncbi:MAG: outer membrane lipoprotein-sorting protein [bacterium]